jgi:hypothetical protein
MDTSIRASFKDANRAHASTATKPLLRPDGVIMPAHTQPTLEQARLKYWAENPDAHRRTLAVCYREALNEEGARLPVTPALITSSRRWLMGQFAAVIDKQFWPLFLNGPQHLEHAITSFEKRTVVAESPCHYVPVSADNNDPHPVWSPIENLLFRFVHDYAHFSINAPATFEGELAVARHTLTPEVRKDDALARFLASESVGQVALAIEDGVYPRQVISYGILEFI